MYFIVSSYMLHLVVELRFGIGEARDCYRKCYLLVYHHPHSSQSYHESVLKTDACLHYIIANTPYSVIRTILLCDLYYNATTANYSRSSLGSLFITLYGVVVTMSSKHPSSVHSLVSIITTVYTLK